MALNINQFAMSTVQGQMDMNFIGPVISGQVDAAVAVPLVAGQAVKIATTAGGVPKFLPLAADTDITYGFVARNLKDTSFAASAAIEVAMLGGVMYMTANGAITRGAKVEVVSASSKVAPSAGVNPVVGFAYDAAAADGDIIRVFIQTPLSTQVTSAVQTATVVATLAEINAGKTLIAAQTGKKIKVVDYAARVAGNFAAGTAVLLQSSNGSPVVVSTIAEAALTNGTINMPTSANNTLGAGFAADLGTSDGLVVANSGSAQTTGTSITFTITYQQA